MKLHIKSMYLFQYFAGLEITFGKNTVYTSLIHKMRTFIENYLHFMKNCIRPHYEKLKSLKSGFIENSIFENNRDPCPQNHPTRYCIHIGGLIYHTQFWVKSTRRTSSYAVMFWLEKCFDVPFQCLFDNDSYITPYI